MQAAFAARSRAEANGAQGDCFLDENSFAHCCCGSSPQCLKYHGAFETCCAHLMESCPTANIDGKENDYSGWVATLHTHEVREPGRGVKLRGYPGPPQDCFPDHGSFSACCCGAAVCDAPERSSHRCCDHILHNCPMDMAWQMDSTAEDDVFVEGQAPVVELDAAQRAAFATEGFVSLPSMFQLDTVEKARRFLDEVVWMNDSSSRPPISVRVNLAHELRDSEMYEVSEKEVLREFSQEEVRRTRTTTYRLECEAVVQSPLSPWGRLANDPKLMAIIDELTLDDACKGSGQGLCAPPVINGCLFFERGTQQGLHDDTWYSLASDTAGGMVGVWIALDDVDTDNGPLIWFPGTHLWDEVALSPEAPSRQQRLMPGIQAVLEMHGPAAAAAATADLHTSVKRKLEEQNWEQRSYFARAGDVGIWHERLIHGGAQIKDMSRTRRSLVIHYARFKLNAHPLANLLDQHLHQGPGGCLDQGICVMDELAVMMLWRSSWLRLSRTFGSLDEAMHLADADDNGAISLQELNEMLAFAGMDTADRSFLLRRASIAKQHI